MLTNRIVGAFTFRKGVYAEVKADTSFTSTAWILVVVFAFLNQLGTYASEDLFDWVIDTAIGKLTTVVAFAGYDPAKGSVVAAAVTTHGGDVLMPGIAVLQYLR
jgi:hypothetical protein